VDGFSTRAVSEIRVYLIVEIRIIMCILFMQCLKHMREIQGTVTWRPKAGIVKSENTAIAR
jgi:hypothetical protein